MPAPRLLSLDLAEHHGERLLAAVNFGTVHATLGMSSAPTRRAMLLLSSDQDRVAGDVDLASLVLLPSEAVLLLIAPRDEPDGSESAGLSS